VPGLRFTLNVAEPVLIGVCPRDLLPWAITTLCGTGEALAKSIVTFPAFAENCLVS
jgi:hypothetical protein